MKTEIIDRVFKLVSMKLREDKEKSKERAKGKGVVTRKAPLSTHKPEDVAAAGADLDKYLAMRKRLEEDFKKFVENNRKKLRTLTAAAVLAGSVANQEPGDEVPTAPNKSDTEQHKTPRPIKTPRK